MTFKLIVEVGGQAPLFLCFKLDKKGNLKVIVTILPLDKAWPQHFVM